MKKKIKWHEPSDMNQVTWIKWQKNQMTKIKWHWQLLTLKCPSSDIRIKRDYIQVTRTKWQESNDNQNNNNCQQIIQVTYFKI